MWYNQISGQRTQRIEAVSDGVFSIAMTLLVYWSAHATQFHYILKSDRNLTWINLFFLLFVSIIPFTTAFLSQHISFRFSIGVYWLSIVVLILIQLNYAVALFSGKKKERG
jgi:uncharacterized membrane protein